MLGKCECFLLAVLMHLAYSCEFYSAASDAKARGIGSAYRNLVFIAIHPNGPNLPLGSKPLDSSDTLDHDILSDDFSDTDYSGDNSSENDEAKPRGGSGTRGSYQENRETDEQTPQSTADKQSREGSGQMPSVRPHQFATWPLFFICSSQVPQSKVSSQYEFFGEEFINVCILYSIRIVSPD
jgi:hypothetical protein